MDNKPKEKQNDPSSTDENDKFKFTNPNRRQEEDRATNVESPRDHASRSDPGSSESPPSDGRGDPQRDSDQDASGRRRQTEE